MSYILNILENCRNSNSVNGLIYASSSSVYGLNKEYNVLLIVPDFDACAVELGIEKGEEGEELGDSAAHLSFPSPHNTDSPTLGLMNEYLQLLCSSRPSAKRGRLGRVRVSSLEQRYIINEVGSFIFYRIWLSAGGGDLARLIAGDNGGWGWGFYPFEPGGEPKPPASGGLPQRHTQAHFSHY